MGLSLGRGRASATSILYALATGAIIAASGGGLLALLAYGAVVAAFALGPAAPIAALRETSVVFAAFIGRFFLGEALTPRRVGACAVVALGAICLGYQQ